MEEELASISKSRTIELMVKGLGFLEEKLGYKYIKSKQCFIMNTSSGYSVISILASNYWPLFIGLDLIYSIRIDAVEELRSRFIDSRFGNFTKYDVKNWTTVSRVVNFDGVRRTIKSRQLKDETPFDVVRGFVVTTEQDVGKVVLHFIKNINEEGLPFLEAPISIEEIALSEKKMFLAEVKENPYIFPGSCINFLILLFLAKDPDLTNMIQLVNEIIEKEMPKYVNDELEYPRFEAVLECIEYVRKTQ